MQPLEHVPQSYSHISHWDPSLSANILPRIFVNLPLEDLAVCLRVSKLWKEILSEDACWSTIGYETLSERSVMWMASDIWDDAVNRGLQAAQKNEQIKISALKFICASHPLAQGLMIFGLIGIVDKITLSNTHDIPPEVDSIKFIRLKGTADLFDPTVKSPHYSDKLLNCKIFFGKGTNASERFGIECFLEGKNCFEKIALIIEIASRTHMLNN